MKPEWKEIEESRLSQTTTGGVINEELIRAHHHLRKIFIFIALIVLAAAAAFLISDILSTTSGSDSHGALLLDTDLVGMKEKVFGRGGGEEYWQKRGNGLAKAGMYEGAIECYDNQLSINASDGSAWQAKAAALSALGRHEEALSCLDRSTEIAPASSEAWFAKGSAMAALGKDEDALGCYDKSLVLSPRSAHIWMATGVALATLGKQEDAIYCLDRAIELEPVPSGDVWRTKADILASMDSMDRAGSLDEAVRCYDNALLLNSSDGKALYGKGQALISIGRTDEANLAFSAAEKLGVTMPALVSEDEALEEAAATPDRAVHSYEVVQGSSDHLETTTKEALSSASIKKEPSATGEVDSGKSGNDSPTPVTAIGVNGLHRASSIFDNNGGSEKSKRTDPNPSASSMGTEHASGLNYSEVYSYASAGAQSGEPVAQEKSQSMAMIYPDLDYTEIYSAASYTEVASDASDLAISPEGRKSKSNSQDDGLGIDVQAAGSSYDMQEDEVHNKHSSSSGSSKAAPASSGSGVHYSEISYSDISGTYS